MSVEEREADDLNDCHSFSQEVGIRFSVVLVGLAENACYPVCYCVVNCSFLSMSDVGPSSRNEASFLYIYIYI